MLNARATQKFETFVRDHKGRLTPQRQFIVHEFLELNGHYSIDELHQHLRKKGQVINPSTIFRTLKLLVQAGVAVERQFANGNTKFDVNVAHHDHLICLTCGKIVEFDSPKLEDIQMRIVRSHGFEMEYHKHEIYGHCSGCRKEKKGSK
jgi:Fur family transcriptional regulator, ferric uptake regulator